ncbi:MAG: GAF domain-containing protein, partial [Chloroflexota bacterium]
FHPAVLDGIQAGFLILDRDFRVLRSNRFTQDWIKRSAEELHGRHCFVMIHARDSVCPDCPAAITFQTGESAHAVHTGLDAAGNLTYAGITTHPIVDEHGQVLYVMEYVRDISESAKFEQETTALIQALRESEDQLLRRNNELEVLNAVASAVGKTLDLNEIAEGALDSVLRVIGLHPKAGIFVVDQDEHCLRLMAHRGLMPEFVEEESRVELGECLCGLAAQTGELICSANSVQDIRHTRSADREPHSHVVVPLKSRDLVHGVLFLYVPPSYVLTPSDERLFRMIGRQIGVAIENARLYQSTDEQLQKKVTELTDALEAARRERAKAQEIERRKDEFVSMISHDLRQPLTALMGHAEWVCRLLRDKGEQRATIGAEAILRSADRLNSMIQDLVDSARMESGHVEMHMRPTDLVRLIAEIGERVGEPDNHLRLRIESPEAMPAALVDPDRIERVITNLIGNALKYSPPGTPVIIRLTQQANEVTVSVVDQGVGIPPEDLPHLFQKYYRARADRQVEGLGLGLYISQMVVAAHGGRIWAESELGKGSTFHFSVGRA